MPRFLMGGWGENCAIKFFLLLELLPRLNSMVQAVDMDDWKRGMRIFKLDKVRNKQAMKSCSRIGYRKDNEKEVLRPYLPLIKHGLSVSSIVRTVSEFSYWDLLKCRQSNLYLRKQ